MSKLKHFHKAPVKSPDDLLAKFEPYIKPVVWGLGALVVLLLAIAYWRSQVVSRAANQWREFSSAYYETAINRAPDSMSQFSERFPQTTAGLAAEQIAGDILMRDGLAKQVSEQEKANENFEAALKRFQKVVDLSPEKSGLMYDRAVYSLAYAHEALFQFDAAIRHYTSLMERSSPLSELARRGSQRCQEALALGFAAAFDNIETETSGPAPGVGLPPRPDISPPSAGGEENARSAAGDPPPAANSAEDPAPEPPAGSDDNGGG
jgi:tetratricopeptide (TPR) repeat protein